jgi:cell wall-associated NlpC family hydrolase
MQQLTRFIGVVAALIVLLSSFNTGECAVVNSNSRLSQAQYWVSKLAAPDEVIMSPTEINDYNAEIRAGLPDTVFDLRVYPASLFGKTLTELLTASSFPKDRVYAQGMPASAGFFANLHNQINLGGVKDYNEVGYGLTATRTNVRTFPTNTGIFKTAGDRDFDLFQETALNPGEPVVILHKSADAKWYFVQTANYRGWVPTANVALASDRQEWLKYLNEESFLVVTANKISLPDSTKAPLVFEMGAKLILAKSEPSNSGSYLVKLPARDDQGKLYFKQAVIAKSADVSVGYLPYTRANIIEQAFKTYGMPYGWGGLHDSVDCSSLTMNIYRSFGFALPRNADQQEVKVGKTVHLTQDPGKRAVQLNSLEPGATLHMNGHVMLYLGKDSGKFYTIHSLASYVERLNDGTLRRVRPMKVVVSDLDLVRGTGKTFAQSLTVVKNIEW